MDLKQILRLHLDGFSNRKIGSTLGISRNTVNNYLHLFKKSEHDLQTLLGFDNSKLADLFSTDTGIDPTRLEVLSSYFEQMNKQLKLPGFTFDYHYRNYLQEVENPYSYTQFLAHYHRQHPKHKSSMKLSHIAGEKMFVDYAGKKLNMTDKISGKLTELEVFVAILPSSQYTYVEACHTQQQTDFIRCCENALLFFGGVPKMIVSDNLKSAVTKACKYEPSISKNFKDFAHHYGCVINPTRSYSPQDKALVENAVHLTYQRIYQPMRQMTFFDLADINRQIKTYLSAHNDRLLATKKVSRRTLFEQQERHLLKPLAVDRYQIKQHRRAKVQKMGYVYFSGDQSYYSVPHQYIGHFTRIESTQTTIEVYHQHQRIALHLRNPSQGSYNTKKEHLRSEHQHYSDWSPAYFRSKASQHGPCVEKCVMKMIENPTPPEINYRKALGLIQLHKNYGSQRLNNACQKAWELDMVGYKHIENMLKNHTDQHATLFQTLEDEKPEIPKHENIRGAHHYK